MTVAQLIDALGMFDPDDIVLVEGYEYGLCDIEKHNIHQIKFKKDVISSYYAGPHREDEDGEFCGIVIRRGFEI